MEAIERIFSTLTAAFGPVGALFVIIAGYLLRRLFTIQDKQMDSAVADAKLQADLMNAFNNMKGAFDNVANLLRDKR